MSDELKKNELAMNEADEMEEQDLDLDDLGQVTGGGMRNKVYVSKTKDIDDGIKKRI